MSGGVPPSSRARSRAPVSRSKLIQKAASLYERFSGHEAEEYGRVKKPTVPNVLVAIGTLDFIGYTTVRDGETEKYIHKFAAVDKPIFCVSPDGKQIFLIGGGYDFTELGIVDKSDLKHRKRR